MAKVKQHRAGGELLERATEGTQVEQYWILADRSGLHKPPKHYQYIEELTYLQIELIKLQEWIKHNGLKLCVVFEGRDAAGKGGVIKRITDPLNPRSCRVAALAAHRERARAVVLSALCGATAVRRGNRAVRPQLVQPRGR